MTFHFYETSIAIWKLDIGKYMDRLYQWIIPTFPLQEVGAMTAILERDTVFKNIKDSIKADNKGQVMLGHEFSGKTYRVSLSAHGEILLTPLTVIPERDIWLYKNPQALAMFHDGLAEAAAGRVTDGEDFSQYANDEI